MLNVLCLFAHPDDETILAGGTLALLASHGAAVHYVSATRGEGGELGEPPGATREAIGEVREAELVCAVGKLGGRSLTFLGYVDPVVGSGGELHAFEADPVYLAGQIAMSVRQAKIDTVITHGSNGEYGHPAHLLMHRATRLAVETFGEGAPAMYSFAAAFPGHPRPRLANADDPAHFVLDVAPALERKLAAAECHKTQNALFVRRRSEEEGRPVPLREVLLTREGLHRHWPREGNREQDALARLLNQLPQARE